MPRGPPVVRTGGLHLSGARLPPSRRWHSRVPACPSPLLTRSESRVRPVCICISIYLQPTHLSSHPSIMTSGPSSTGFLIPHQLYADFDARLPVYGRPECRLALPAIYWQVTGHLLGSIACRWILASLAYYFQHLSPNIFCDPYVCSRSVNLSAIWLIQRF